MNIDHIAYALLIQVATWLLTGNWWLGVMLATGILIGREHSQREYKIGKPSILKPWEAFDVWNWSRDARLDLACPMAAVVVLVGGLRAMSRAEASEAQAGVID